MQSKLILYASIIFVLLPFSIRAQPFVAQILTTDSIIQTISLFEYHPDSIVFFDTEDNTFQSLKAKDILSIWVKGKIKITSAYFQEVDNKILLEQLHDGESFNLLKDLTKELFYIQSGVDEIIFLPQNKKALVNKLEEISTFCLQVKRQARLVKPKERSLKYFVKNLDNCNPRLFPYTRYGVTGGVPFADSKQFFPHTPDSELITQYGRNFSIGIFGEAPVFRGVNSLYLNLEAFFSNQQFNIYNNDDGSNENLNLEFNSIEIPFQLKYYFSIKNVHPFLSAGVLFFKPIEAFEQRSKLLRRSTGPEWEFSQVSYEQIKASMGLTYGIGLGIPIDHRRIIYVQANWRNASDLINNNPPNFSYFLLSMGINY